MKKTLTITAMFLCAWAWAQQAALYVGSDWDEASIALRAAWDKPDFAKQAGVTLTVVDQPEHVDAEVQAKWKQQQAIRIEPRAYPAFAYFAKDGTCTLMREGVRDPADLPALIAEGKTRDKAVAAALKSGDPEAIGRALAPLVEALGQKSSKERCKALWQALEKADPQDKTGWAFAFSFDPTETCYKVQDFAKKKDYAGGEAFIKDLEAKPQGHLSNNQRQGLMLLRYVLHKDNPAQAQALDDLLRRTLAIDATTHFGIAAQGLLCLRGQGPVAIPYGWRAKDARAGRQNWIVSVGVAKVVRGPGHYALTLKREKGRGAMTLHGLSIGGRRFDQTLTLKPGESATVAFEVADAKPELTLDVSFENPDAAERGTLALRRTLPPRPAADPTTVSGPSGHWAKGEDDFVIPREVYAEILAKQGGADFLNAFFSDNEWVLDFLTSGDPLTDWPTSLRALDTICWLCPEVYDSPILRRWATAAALNAAADPTDVIFLLQEMLAIRREGFLWRGADDLRCDQLRYTLIPAQCDADNARWLAPRHNVPPRQYGGVCWAAPYRLNNFFGDSIHGSDYYKPWEHAYLRHEASRKVGAVCGGLSYYGSAAAKTHGLPSTTGGQPAHCAYLVWAPEQKRWTICYNVSPHTGSHFAPLSDVWKYSYHELFADAFARPGLRDSYGPLWEARHLRNKLAPAPRRSKMTCDAYEWGGTKLPADPAKLKRIGSWQDLDTLNLDQAGRKERVLLVWTGYIEAPRDLQAALTVRSDDGAGLWLDGRHVAGKDGLHGLEGTTHRAALTQGRHPFELRYFNNTGGRAIEFTLAPIEQHNAEVEALYRRAANLCPQNLSVWRDWADWLRAQDAPATAWRDLGDRAAKGLRDHVEPAWDFLQAQVLPNIKAKAGKDALRDALVAWHGIIRQGPQKTAEFCDYPALLDAQAKLADNDPEVAFAIFAADLPTQYGTPDAFGALMRWGGDRFLVKNPAYAQRYVAALEALVNKGGDTGGLAKYLREAILAASKAENADAFRALCALQNLLTPVNRTFLDPKMEGRLLSDRGLLRLSSTSRWDNPQAYLAVIDGLSPTDCFHTSQEGQPWAEVVLPGMAEVSGVYLLNRGDQNNGRLVPAVVEVSEDGKTWRKVASIDKNQGDYHLTFPAVRAKRVRITCHPQDRTFLHLRKFCVFGKPLY